MIIQRRGALGGLLGLMAAPFIVRAASLMPISATDTYGFGGVLTWQQVTDEAARLLRLHLNRRDDVAGWADWPDVTGKDVSQQYVGTLLTDWDAAHSLQEVSSRILEPAMAVLAAGVKPFRRVLTEACRAPVGVDAAAISERGGCGLRGVRAYDFENEVFQVRFDIRTIG